MGCGQRRDQRPDIQGLLLTKNIKKLKTKSSQVTFPSLKLTILL
jgi:hypothetical protein